MEEKKTSIYLFPGYAANDLIFEKLKFSEDYIIHKMNWEIPKIEESLYNYAYRMSKKIKDKNPILIGVSLGGVLCQELCKIIHTKKIIIISSPKSLKECTSIFTLFRFLKVHRWVPFGKIDLFLKLYNLLPNKRVKRKVQAYNIYLTYRNKTFLKWATREFLNWKPKAINKDLIQISGGKDHIVLKDKIDLFENLIILKKARHTLILTHHKWLNENLPKLLSTS